MTTGAMIVLGLSVLATDWTVAAGALIALVMLSVNIYAAVQTNRIVSQRIIFSLSTSAQARSTPSS